MHTNNRVSASTRRLNWQRPRARRFSPHATSSRSAARCLQHLPRRSTGRHRTKARERATYLPHRLPDVHRSSMSAATCLSPRQQVRAGLSHARIVSKTPRFAAPREHVSTRGHDPHVYRLTCSRAKTEAPRRVARSSSTRVYGSPCGSITQLRRPHLQVRLPSIAKRQAVHSSDVSSCVRSSSICCVSLASAVSRRR